MPDDGTCDDKPPPDVVIGNRPRSRSQSVESRSIRRFYSGRANPALVARGITIREKRECLKKALKKKTKERKAKSLRRLHWKGSRKKRTLMGHLALMVVQLHLQLHSHACKGT